ncbi:MAG: hypothetical protein QOD94_3124 [Alphaproteobacteria bacterium]|nr:hypothetical protein [Alphaproteobacteria bacterium]
MSRGEVAEIAIHVRTIGQLFNSFDPSPFHEKDLDHNAEDCIATWARELSEDAPLRIVVYLPPDEGQRPEAAALGASLSHHFEQRARQFKREQRELFRIGRRSLAIGVAVLAGCLTASQTLAPLIPNSTLARVVEESLIILGWVANWRPLEIYLYDWWPIRRNIRLYCRIAAAPVTVTTLDG